MIKTMGNEIENIIFHVISIFLEKDDRIFNVSTIVLMNAN